MSLSERGPVTPPTPGVKLFTDAVDWQNNACTSGGWIIDPWDLYADGYREAADHLVERIVEGQSLTLDTIVYPIVFLYRQYLELRLKQLIPLSGRLLYLDIDLHSTMS